MLFNFYFVTSVNPSSIYVDVYGNICKSIFCEIRWNVSWTIIKTDLKYYQPNLVVRMMLHVYPCCNISNYLVQIQLEL